LEEAQVRCGGPEALQRAVARGDVIQGQHAGRTMFYFPEVISGRKEAYKSTVAIGTCKATHDRHYAEVSQMVQNLNWQIQSQQKALEVPTERISNSQLRQKTQCPRVCKQP